MFPGGFPRRKRVLAIAIFALLLWGLLPFEQYNLPRQLFTSILRSSSSSSWIREDCLQHVDPLIGTLNGGHVFPGATLPYGMAKAVADVDLSWENAGGFVSDNSTLITGFSSLHDSGTGGASSLGNFPLFVHPGCPADNATRCAFALRERAVARENGSAKAYPGYFGLGLNNSVRVEMTATGHSTLFSFKFPSTTNVVLADGEHVPNSPLIALELDDLARTRNRGDILVDAGSGRVSGTGKFRPSFGLGDYTAHVCADFRGAQVRTSGIFVDGRPMGAMQGYGSNVNGIITPGGAAGAWIQFHRPHKDEILVRVGLSFLSIEQACRNAEAEIPDFDFDRVVEASQKAWREKLSVIQADTTEVSSDLVTTFWSGLYRAMLSPQDYSGENPLWNSTEPYFDSFYCIWDSFRAQHPLLTIVDPASQSRMIRSLIDTYKHEGKLPDCRMSFSKGFTQGGSNADIVLADSFVKNLSGPVDWNLAYEAVVSDAEEPPLDWATSGRGNIASWKELGYIPKDPQDREAGSSSSSARSVSRTVEYAYDDFAIAQMAQGLGKIEDAKKYLARSQNWKNLWNADQEDDYSASNFKGFLQPRLRNGTFVHQHTALCSPVYEQHKCYFDTIQSTYEGSPWLYSFFAPHDHKSLVSLLGGPSSFASRLDHFHESGIAYMGNEQTFLTVFQFHYAARPGRSAYWVHRYIPSLFNSSVNGIPGNDDCAMGAFSAFAFMGFFPVAGQDVYLLTPPLFREVSIATPSGRRAVIRNVNFDAAYENIYIQSAKLNGRAYSRNWIGHDFFVKGGVLEYRLGRDESAWGTREDDLPPSMSTR